MKYILYLFLENNVKSYEVYDSIRESGFNGTVAETASIRHMMDEKPLEENHFFSLSDWHAMEHPVSTFSMYVVDKEKVEPLKEAIRKHTNNFTLVKGGMFTKKAEDYEGSF